MSNTDESRQRELRKLRVDLGPVVLAALEDPKTVEVVLNADGRLWQEKLGEPMRDIGTMPVWQAEALIGTVAAILKVTATRENCLLEGELPDGSRFAGQLPPVVSAPTFAIRKHASAVFSLAQYVAGGIMTPRQMEALCTAVRERRNLLVIGGVGSGKTTLCNAIIAEVVRQYPDDRLLIIEDTTELQCSAADYVQYRTSEQVNMTRLLRTTLRMRPDRILVGEVRGSEAMDLLFSWNLGHPGGIATLHANDAKSALSRLVMLVSMHPESPKPIEPLIADAELVIVHISRSEGGRKVREILGVTGYDQNSFQVSQL
jgi:type IV secretion system protein TrbB